MLCFHLIVVKEVCDSALFKGVPHLYTHVGPTSRRKEAVSLAA
jgi:hypothetical protein